MQKKRQATSKINWRPGMAYISPSNIEGKRWKMEFADEKDNIFKTVHFGSSEHENYTMHKDKDRQAAYLKRHAKDPVTYDSPGELSRIILWSAPTMTQGMLNYERKHKWHIMHKLS